MRSEKPRFEYACTRPTHAARLSTLRGREVHRGVGTKTHLREPELIVMLEWIREPQGSLTDALARGWSSSTRRLDWASLRVSPFVTLRNALGVTVDVVCVRACVRAYVREQVIIAST